MKRVLVFLLLFFVYSSASAQEETDTVILIPTVYVGPGASAHLGSGAFIFTNGVELENVREERFTRRAIQFPAVDLVPVRTHLQIYSIDHVLAPRVRVEVRQYFAPTGAPLLSKEIALDAGFAQNEFPFEALRGAMFHVTVTPLPSASGEVPRIWAVMLQTPQ